MKSRIALIVLAMAVATPTFAADRDIRILAEHTGLTVRQVQMLVGNRTPFAEYRRSYDRSLATFQRELGSEVAAQLIAGETVVLEPRPEARVATLDEPGKQDRMP